MHDPQSIQSVEQVALSLGGSTALALVPATAATIPAATVEITTT
jgi:hypothetical protein